MVDINCASESELVKLPGIGSKKARAIIQHRTTRGPFRKLWELTQIPGIGEATVRMLQPYVATLVDTNPCRQLRNRLVRPKATTAQDPVTCICSWNIQRLSLSKPDFALHLIADVMSAMHVVAVQEVMDVRVLEKLLVLLPNNWACHTSPQQGNPGSTYTESYALLYRADRFQLHDCFVVNADTAPVTRPPMVVVLQDQLTGRHTAYVNFHAVFQGSASAREAECASVQAVADQLASVVDTCLAGDFNVPSDSPMWRAWASRGWRSALSLGEPTTVMGSAFDNIWLSPDAQASGCPGRVLKYLDHSTEPVSTVKAVSDHYPIAIDCPPLDQTRPERRFPAPFHQISRSQDPCLAVQAATTWHVSSALHDRYGNTSTRLLT